jgi:hypothetical protein
MSYASMEFKRNQRLKKRRDYLEKAGFVYNEPVSYFDDNGLLHDKHPLVPAENVGLWTVEMGILRRLYAHTCNDRLITDALFATKVDGKWECWPTADWGRDQKLSRDEMIARVCWFFLTENEERHYFWNNMFKWDNHLWWQPQDVVLAAYCADSWFGKLMLPFLMLNILVTCSLIGLYRDGGLSTDGYLLSFVRLHCLARTSWLARITLKLVNKIIPYRLKSHMDSYYEKNKDKGVTFSRYAFKNPDLPNVVVEGNKIGYPNHWRIIFSCYFTDPMNPINKICVEIWP